MMNSFLAAGRHSQRIANSQGSSSQSSSSASTPTHHPSSRRAAKSKAPVLSLSISPSASQGSPCSTPTKHTPDSRCNAGVVFDIDWDYIYLGGKKLRLEKLGYRVKSSSATRGRKGSRVWEYGADLQYQDENNRFLRLWLCKLCHTKRLQTAAKSVDGYNHIITHLQREHRIDVGSGELLPDDPRTPADPWQAAQATIAGAGRTVTRIGWQEEEFASALVDWAIVQDQSFLAATSVETRGLLTWNRVNLLKALPSSHTTLSTWIYDAMVQRKEEIRLILNLAVSKIALSVDIWTSPNHISKQSAS